MASEAAPFYHGYIAKVTGENISDHMADQLDEVEQLFGSLDEQSALARYAPGKWSIKEILGHLTDAERIFGYRLLRIGRGDRTPLPGFDEKTYVPAGQFDTRPLSSLIGEFRSVRESTEGLMHGLPLDCWANQGEASGMSITARALAYIIVGHVNHHLGVLRDRYGLGASAQ
jgi:DinB family protein